MERNSHFHNTYPIKWAGSVFIISLAWPLPKKKNEHRAYKYRVHRLLQNYYHRFSSLVTAAAAFCMATVHWQNMQKMIKVNLWTDIIMCLSIIIRSLSSSFLGPLGERKMAWIRKMCLWLLEFFVSKFTSWHILALVDYCRNVWLAFFLLVSFLYVRSAGHLTTFHPFHRTTFNAYVPRRVASYIKISNNKKMLWVM